MERRGTCVEVVVGPADGGEAVAVAGDVDDARGRGGEDLGHEQGRHTAVIRRQSLISKLAFFTRSQDMGPSTA